MTAGPEQRSLAERRAAAVRRSVETIRQSAGTAELVALTYGHIAATSANRAGARPPPRDWEPRLRALAEDERQAGQRMWRRVTDVDDG